jgi:hypothetical protein
MNKALFIPLKPWPGSWKQRLLKKVRSFIVEREVCHGRFGKVWKEGGMLQNVKFSGGKGESQLPVGGNHGPFKNRAGLTDICLVDMFLCMRTMLNLDDNLVRAVKGRAAQTGQTLSSMIETVLSEILEQGKKKKHSFRLWWVTVKGGVQPGVYLAGHVALIDRMEGRS